MVIVKLTSSGTFAYKRLLESTQSLSPNGANHHLVAGADGSVTLALEMRAAGSLTGGATPGVVPAELYDLVVIALTPQGNFDWTIRMSGFEHRVSLAPHPSSGVVLFADTYGEPSFNAPVGGDDGTRSLLVAHVDDGADVWRRSIVGDNLVAGRLATSPSGVHVAGTFRGEVTFGVGEVNEATHIATGNPGPQPFILRLKPWLRKVGGDVVNDWQRPSAWAPRARGELSCRVELVQQLPLWVRVHARAEAHEREHEQERAKKRDDIAEETSITATYKGFGALRHKMTRVTTHRVSPSYRSNIRISFVDGRDVDRRPR